MWLVNTATLQLQNFLSGVSVDYAILSHTWEEEELDHALFKTGSGRELKGFRKIQLCCEQARADNLNYAWIDTVCIDKTSSAELSEAINSMYAWYAAADICYVYLADIHDPHSDSQRENAALLAQCRWFTRGWTLQELLAPIRVSFYTADWIFCGTRNELSPVIERITGIEEQVLNGQKGLDRCSIAQRMSWAAKRVTTRPEDVAYCLLGIFGVNMPLLYGENDRAFKRLQEEIIKTSDDESIFAWTGVGEQGSGMLAKSPDFFMACGDIHAAKGGIGQSPYSMTNLGLSIDRGLVLCEMNTYVMKLGCFRQKRGVIHREFLGLFICRTISDTQYLRVRVDGVDLPNTSRWDEMKPVRRLLHISDNVRQDLAPHGGLPVISFRASDPSEPSASQEAIPSLLDGSTSTETILGNRVQAADHGPFQPWWSKIRAAHPGPRWNFAPGFGRRRLVKEAQMNMEAGRAVIIPMVPITSDQRHSLPIYQPEPLQNFDEGIRCYQQQKLVRELRFGFNIDCEPVCFLQLAKWPEFVHLILAAYSKMLSKLAPREFRHSVDANSLVHQRNYNKVDGTLALPHAENPQVWTLRGHRSQGLSVSINHRSPLNCYKLTILMVPASTPSGLLWNAHLQVERIFVRDRLILTTSLILGGTASCSFIIGLVIASTATGREIAIYLLWVVLVGRIMSRYSSQIGSGDTFGFYMLLAVCAGGFIWIAIRSN